MSTPSLVSDEVVETVARAIERAWSRNHASIKSDPDIAWRVWTPEAEAALEASGYAALKADNERMKEGLAALVSACEGLEWSSFTEQGWKRVSDARTILQEVSR